MQNSGLCFLGWPQNKNEGKWKKNKYPDLTRELKKLCNIKVAIIPVVIGAFGTVTKGLLKGLEDLKFGGWVETIQTTALLRTDRIVKKSWRFEETCSHSNSSEKPSAKTDVKNIQGVNNKTKQYVHTHTHIYIYKLATLVEGNPKGPFSVTTIPRCWEGTTPFPGLLHFTFNPYLIILLSVKKSGIK